MLNVFHYHHDYGRAIFLEPPIQFGNLSVCHTRTIKVVLHIHLDASVIYTVLFCHRGAQYWNSLPTHIKDHVQFGYFKSSVKTYLFVFAVICVSV